MPDFEVLVTLEEPDEQQDYENQCNEAATDVHAVSFRLVPS
jgi:hypothetical protein